MSTTKLSGLGWLAACVGIGLFWGLVIGGIVIWLT